MSKVPKKQDIASPVDLKEDALPFQKEAFPVQSMFPLQEDASPVTDSIREQDALPFQKEACPVQGGAFQVNKEASK